MKNNYFRGSIGALIGAILFSLPWVLLYVYGNILLSLLAAVVAFGAITFYKLFGGKLTNKTPIIITISSLASITVATFIIIPLWLIAKEGHGLSWFWFEYLYSNGKFVTAIIGDYIISLVFTLLGISGVISNLKKGIYEVSSTKKEEPIDLEGKTFEEQVKYLEDIYAKYNAFSKETAISEFKIMKEINAINKLKFMLKMEKKGIVVAPFIKSYFDKEAVYNPEKGKKNWKKNIIISTVIGVICGLLISILILGPVLLSDSTNDTAKQNEEKIETKIYSYKNISIELPEDFKELPDDASSNFVSYLRYGDTGYVDQVFLQQVDVEEVTKEFYNYYKNAYIVSLKEKNEITNVEDITINDLNAFRFNMHPNEYEDEYYYIYVIFGNKKVHIVMFYTNIGDNMMMEDSKLSLFESEAITYVDTLKIKKD